jgi:hypothetical protein
MVKTDVSKEPLLQLISEIDSHLTKEISVYAVGGTAMTLLNLKASTKDIDFNLKHEDLEEFKKALAKTIHGYRIDIYADGSIFTQQLPQDYEARAIKIETKLKNIKLYSIHPLDIVITKIGRLNERDWEDIQDCIKKYGLNKKQIEKRGKQVIYAGNEEVYKYNLEDTLKKIFTRPAKHKK